MLERQASTGVVIDFTARIEDGNKLVIVDTTKPQPDFTDTIYDWRLSLTTDFMKEGIYEVDLIAYLYSNRVDRELYIITSDMVGKPESSVLPDGLYTVSIRVNNTYTRTHNFMIMQTIEAEATKVLDEAGFKVDVRPNSYQYQNSTKYDYEKMSLVYSLLSSIQNNALDGNYDAVKAAYTQLKKLLKLL